ncbi:MAG: AAA family ATPase [Caldilineaceae bacterium SB0661_bin_32]|uniref:AAA family ATPase n=1 Tax=Caldilineaceae bacterium SB0661_bin_32 TaxID=2605255 RepID=A0A6B1DDB3_9CHLR|nr:AAA family ATPase [Caldilineaceae bacterium SB0661_bin_32]
MIKSLKVEGLNNRTDADLEFNEDLNIITGKNGSGKTTLLKLLWYLISGNLERAIREILFRSVSIKTDSFFLSITPTNSDNSRLECTFQNGKKTVESFEMPLRDYFEWIHNLNVQIARTMQGSLFFPTFRRIEGGFAEVDSTSFADLEWYHSDRPRRTNTERATDELQEAMSRLSRGISFYDHKFIASISTHDIVELLREEYADISGKTNSLHVQFSNEITQKITETKGRRDDANPVLNDIKKRVEQVTQEREGLLRPFSVLAELIHDIFQYKGIRVNPVITLGETTEAIASDKLSAGEKQMLSFLCYNTFSENAAIFIDEPELSLHVDWQRLLLPTLLEQGTGNQFFIATHSPFIYAKYPDKEILLGEDRGDN